MKTMKILFTAIILATSFSSFAEKLYSYECHADSARYKSYSCEGHNIVPQGDYTTRIALEGVPGIYYNEAVIFASCVAKHTYKTKITILHANDPLVFCNTLPSPADNRGSEVCRNQNAKGTEYIDVKKITCEKPEAN